MVGMSWAKNLIENPETREKLFPGIRNKSLLELGCLYFAFFYDNTRSPSQEIVKRLWANHCSISNGNIAQELTPQDVMSILRCSKSKAKQHLSLLRTIMIQLWAFKHVGKSI